MPGVRHRGTVMRRCSLGLFAVVVFSLAANQVDLGG